MSINQTTESLSQIGSTIAGGGIIAFRTDTFYGLGADPFNQGAVKRVKQLKGRDDRKPILIVISDVDQLKRFIAAPSNAFAHLAKTFWPGALTLIGGAVPELPDEITAETKTVGVRLPGDEQVRDLVRSCGGALTATSANPADRAPAKSAREVSHYFAQKLDLIVDGGDATTDQPSTVVDACDGVKLIREGVIPWAEIQLVLADLGS